MLTTLQNNLQKKVREGIWKEKKNGIFTAQ
jgi:hypothetical protein